MASELPDDALKARIESAKAAERTALLASLGYDSIDAAKADAEARKLAAEAAKSEAQKAAEERARLVTEAEKAKGLAAVVTEHAGRQLSVLTAEQQAAVKAIAGDDAAAQLRAIDALRPTWATSIETPKPAAPPPAAPTGPSGPGAGAPPASTPTQVDHETEYQRLMAINPIHAARYMAANLAAFLTPPSQ
jgi:hypothetical protein